MGSGATSGTGGRVLQVNVSAGGIPKQPIGEAWVDRLGVAGDGHNDRTVHGGPHRAVCLFGIEAIERLQADGHPVGPGSVGENLTTVGIEWSLLPIGTRARVGDRLLLEIASTAGPCATQRHNFSDGRFSRISIDLFPTDARMYARVLEEGAVRPGDPIELLPIAPDSHAVAELMLDRLDWIAAKSSLAEWRILEDLGVDIRILDDGELIIAAVPAETRPQVNHAYGLARLPNLVDEAKRFFDTHHAAGCLITDGAPWAGSEAHPRMDVFAANPSSVAETAPPVGVRVERLGAADADDWATVREQVAGDRLGPDGSAEFVTRLVASPHAVVVVARQDGAPVGVAWMYTGHKTAWLRGAAVVPAARRQGIHRALVAERARLAAAAGCDLMGAWAEAGSVSARNLAAAGFGRIGSREHHAYVPAGPPAAVA
jgi:MOSC domain-containing protein YiiM/GNAT superfamily N-acetyltransferase